MTIHSDPPVPRGGIERPAAPPKGTSTVISDQRLRELALTAAARVTAALPATTTQDPDSAARRTIAIAVIFESYLAHGALSEKRN